MKNTILDKRLRIDQEKCISCGLCEKSCWNGALKLVKNKPTMVIDKLTDEWNMCWECGRCLAVCPTGALSICDKKPEDMLPSSLLPSPLQMDALITNRRSCRNFKQKNVDKELINHILHIAGNSPTGSCNQVYEFTIIDDISVMKEFTTLLKDEMYKKAEKGVYPPRFTKEDLALFKTFYDKGEEFAFRGAPHLLVCHAPQNRGEWVFDTAIATAYTELLMTANHLGFIYVSTPWAAIKVCEKSRAFLNIPEDHYISCMCGFGYPEFEFKRGVSRADNLKINIVGKKHDNKRNI